MEESLTNSKAEILKLRSALAKSEDKVSLLDHQLEEVSTKFNEELRVRDERMTDQSSELESKANTIAMLTQQLYNTKIRLRNELQAKNSVTAASTSHVTSSAMCVCPHCPAHSKHHATVTGDNRHYVLHEGGGVGPGGMEQVHVNSTAAINTTTVAAHSARSRISRIQRRHFRNTSTPVAHEVGSLRGDPSDYNNDVDDEDDDVVRRSHHTRSNTGNTQRLPTPPMTPRPPPPMASPATSTTIRRASKTVRKQSPSPQSMRNQTSGGERLSSVKVSPSCIAEVATDCDCEESCSATSMNGEKKVLDPVQIHRQGVMPDELRELLQSRGAEGGVHIQQQMIPPRPAPLPPIANSGEGTTTAHELSSSSSRLRGHPHIPSRQHRHFILAKAQGLSSAPSTVRVLHYSPPKQQQDHNIEEVGVASGLLEPGEIKDNERGVAMEGTLLVKETMIDRNDSALQELHHR